jgi:GxxExxY protein
MMNENQIGTIIVDAAISVHSEIGPGLLESVYEVILLHELNQKGLEAERQKPIALNYRGIRFDAGFRADIIVQNKVILEIKSVERINIVHRKQLLTYLKLSGKKLGYILNFGEGLMKNGITRIVNQLAEDR